MVCIISADKDNQQDHYVTISMNNLWIINVASLRIVDAQLRLIVMMRQQVCRLPCWLRRRPIVYLCQ